MGLSKYIEKGANIQAANQARKEAAILNRQLEKEIREVMKTLNSIPKEALSVKERKKAMRKAAKPLIQAAQTKAPVLRGRRKVTVTLKDGSNVTYYPGNLKLSIKEIALRKSSSVFVGPKITKRRKAGDEYGKSRSKVDAYYAAMVEYGTRNMSARPYMRPAFESSKGAMMQIAQQEVKKLMDNWAARNTKR